MKGNEKNLQNLQKYKGKSTTRATGTGCWVGYGRLKDLFMNS